MLNILKGIIFILSCPIIHSLLRSTLVSRVITKDTINSRKNKERSASGCRLFNKYRITLNNQNNDKLEIHNDNKLGETEKRSGSDPPSLRSDSGVRLQLTKVLIHTDYGCYGLFSQEFEDEFQKTYNIEFNSLPDYQPYFDKQNRNKDIESRYDSRLIHIFEQLGKEKSSFTSSMHKSSLTIVTIPTELINDFYISEYDGAEWIWCNISKKYKELFFSNMTDVDKKINIIQQCEKYLIENNIHYV